MRFFLKPLNFFAGASLSIILRPPDPLLQRTMLRSHPADATQIQRVAVPTPNNGVLLKRFFTAIAIVEEFYTKGNRQNYLRYRPPHVLCRPTSKNTQPLLLLSAKSLARQSKIIDRVLWKQRHCSIRRSVSANMPIDFFHFLH